MTRAKEQISVLSASKIISFAATQKVGIPWKDDSVALIMYAIFTIGLELMSNQLGNIKAESYAIVGLASLIDYNVSQQCLEACFILCMIIVY